MYQQLHVPVFKHTFLYIKKQHQRLHLFKVKMHMIYRFLMHKYV